MFQPMPVRNNHIPALQAGTQSFKPGATDMVDLMARAGGAIRLPNPGIAAIHLLFFVFSNAACWPL